LVADYSDNELIQFEDEIAAAFNSGKIRAPVHLYSGNESNIIDVFKEIREKDWVFCTWRSHYQCLLKGVPAKEVREEIFAGRSISLCFPKYRIYSSAIVGGNITMALGVAMGIKRQLNPDEKVYCFIGDMTAETGIAHECIKYSRNNELPIKFIVEDNNLSVCTDTRQVWNCEKLSYEEQNMDGYVYHYKYKSKYPHAGAGKRIQF